MAYTEGIKVGLPQPGNLKLDILPIGLGIGTTSNIDFTSLKREAIQHKYLAFISLTVAFWECIIALKDEVRFIWRCPSQETKATYLFARYFAIGYLCVNVVLSFKWTSSFPAPKSICVHWYIQHGSAFVAQYVASHLTLWKRFLDLNQGRNVAFIFAAFYLAEFVGVVCYTIRTVSAMSFDPSCHATMSVSKDIFASLGFFVFGHSMIWSLVIRGVWQTDRRDSQRLDFRAKFYRAWHEGDGKAAWAACFVGLVCNALYAFARQRLDPIQVSGWPISFLSIATCRYILSTEKEAYIRSRFSHPSSKGKDHSTQPRDGTENGIEITTTIDPAGALNNIGHNGFARSFRLQSSLSSASWLHPTGQHSAMTITSTVNTEPPERVLYTSSTNSFMSHESRQSQTVSTETRETGQTEITAPSRGTVSLTSTGTDIEIGSMHISSSVNSDELRDFWNEIWNGTPSHQNEGL